MSNFLDPFKLSSSLDLTFVIHNLTIAYISKLEEGKCKSLSLKNCKALAGGLDLSLKDFLDKLGFLKNRNRPSPKMIGEALRGNGYTPKQVKQIIDYAEYLKSKTRANKQQ